jgi:hypothetical protein
MDNQEKINPEHVTLFGVEKDDKLYYIGKTKRKICFNKHKSDIINKTSLSSYVYQNKELNKIVKNKNTKIIEISHPQNNNWFEEKINEIVEKHKQNHPLLNAEWMKQGKKSHFEGTGGYWQGKIKDKHTIKRLSESKHKKIVQYNQNGELIKIWDSVKEPATEIFKDYKVINGSASSKLYSTLCNKYTKNKFYKGYYWFHYHQLKKHFKQIPSKLKINEIIKKEKEISRKTFIKTQTKKYTILQYDNNNEKIINSFPNIEQAEESLKISKAIIRRICSGKTKKPKLNLKYGEKILQNITPICNP